MVTAFNKTACLSDMVKEFSNGLVSFNTVRRRLDKGWSPEKALTTPSNIRKNNNEEV